MKNYGCDPDDDVREMVQYEIELNDNAAADLEKNAAELRAEGDRFAERAAGFRAASEKLRKQLAVLKAVLAKEEAA